MNLYIIGIIAIAVMLVLQFILRDRVGGFMTRLISGVILVLALLMIIGAGGAVLFFTSIILSLIGMSELFMAVGIRKGGKPDTLELFGYIGIAVYYLFLGILPREYGWFGIPAALILLLIVYVRKFPDIHITKVALVFFGFVYVAVMLSCVYLLRTVNNGHLHVWLIFLASWGSDTCAYCAGRLFGKHKMAPVLSPKKTIEGAIGGLIGAAVLGAIFGAITRGPVLQYIFITAIGAAVSMVGDLAASAIKRQYEIKDYGTLIPGHGGILDRFDSVIFTAPVICLLTLVFIR
ncbi:MAG: phosphatidate cytidylyltransferase [Eubacterium sp.]|nr:phosphatidate cytidylyltransferase [Eubacterium sp.]